MTCDHVVDIWAIADGLNTITKAYGRPCNYLEVGCELLAVACVIELPTALASVFKTPGMKPTLLKVAARINKAVCFIWTVCIAADGGSSLFTRLGLTALTPVFALLQAPLPYLGLGLRLKGLLQAREIASSLSILFRLRQLQTADASARPDHLRMFSGLDHKRAQVSTRRIAAIYHGHTLGQTVAFAATIAAIAAMLLPSSSADTGMLWIANTVLDYAAGQFNNADLSIDELWKKNL